MEDLLALRGNSSYRSEAASISASRVIAHSAPEVAAYDLSSLMSKPVGGSGLLRRGNPRRHGPQKSTKR